ncbi:CBS domain-containing protein [Pseudomonas cuatrocienegasensis]|uniref:CBS domain-containing protein n=1 Tax=Pseudomonas cuatrocienegasensis TaxID=543360 RepID=A0ABY1BRN4_9PSED|nr:hypothetical protein A7D25_23205 [Pseudomonas sp. 21C1]SER46528.1 CBS domain-containing protein [Pseudomonas cuatrocienegasensis]
MVRDEASAHMIGSATAGLGSVFNQRLLELAEAELGPSPVPYSLMAAGSLVRIRHQASAVEAEREPNN